MAYGVAALAMGAVAVLGLDTSFAGLAVLVGFSVLQIDLFVWKERKGSAL